MKKFFRKKEENTINFGGQKKKKHSFRDYADQKERTAGRKGALYMGMAFIFLLEIWLTFYSSGVVKGVSTKADQYKQEAITDYNMKTVISGDIYDCNGTCLVSHEKPQSYGEYIHGYAYSQILGYNLPITNGESYRLMKLYRDILYEGYNVNSTKGKSLTLTLDHELQMQAYNMLLNNIGEGETGSVVIMDAKTGELKAFVSLPSFNVNNLPGSLSEEKYAKEELENPNSFMSYPVTYKGAVAPGSIFKIVTSVALLENGMEDFETLDDSFIAGDTKIVNHYDDTGTTIDYDTAIVQSSNVYMAKGILKIGGDKLTEVAKRFMIGEELMLDIGTVASNWNLNEKDKDEVAMTAFGQGKTLFSTLNAAMVAQAIANDGVMMTPYMIQTITESNGKVIYVGEENVLNEVTSAKVSNRITSAMIKVGKNLSGLKNLDVEVAAKTGTAQIGGEDNLFNAWLMTFAPADNPEYVIIVNYCGTKRYGGTLSNIAAELYKGLLD